jgi:hypothetical protein
MNDNQLTFKQITCKTIVVHTVTYFVAGIMAFLLFDYESLFSESELRFVMRPTDSRWVMAGPLFQPLRGILFGIVFYLLRDVFFKRKHGWLIMWCVLMVVGLLSAFGPTPGSIEGVVYTTLPALLHVTGMPEILFQTLLLSFVLHYWVNHSERRAIRWSLGIVFFIALALPTLGLLVS